MIKQQLAVAALTLLAAAAIAGCKPKPAADAANTLSPDAAAAQTNASLDAWNAAVATSNSVTSNATAP